MKPDTDFALYFAPEKDELGVNLLTYKTGSDDGYFLLLASPGMDTKETRCAQRCGLRARHLWPDDRQEARSSQESAALRENLNDNDRFEIVRFDRRLNRCSTSSSKPTPVIATMPKVHQRDSNRWRHGD